MFDKRLKISTAQLPPWDPADPGARLTPEEEAADKLKKKGVPETKYTLRRERERGGRYRYTRLKGRFVRYFDHIEDAKSPLIQAGLLGLEAFTSTAEEEVSLRQWGANEEARHRAARADRVGE